MSKNAVNQRFKIAVKELNKGQLKLKKREIAENLNISGTKLSEILGGRMNVGIDLITLLVEKYDFNSFWLLTGQGNMLISDIPKTTENETQTFQEPMYNYGNISVAFVSKYDQGKFLKDRKTSGLPRTVWEPGPDLTSLDSDTLLSIEMVGDSMNDGSFKSLLDADLLLGVEVDKSNWNVTPAWNKYNYIVVTANEIKVCKLLKNEKSDTFLCHFLNEFSTDIELAKSDVKTLYRIIKIKRDPQF